MLICFAGLIFVALTLPGALRKRNGRSNCVPPVINDGEKNVSRGSKDVTILAADRAEYFDLWGENIADPLHFPPPVPPSKPHSYFGNGADYFGTKDDANKID